ncbi:hypothetical protein CDL15_Pgr026476 [Punica granatum]|uniref:Uncharacterized protein n=1 Tax=Punica granatum TaxID=22663 RepID=A0A218X6B8_PUNGR|nr:hypothetical protein CDL15_Pgr026476 [Punica granatum]
MEFGPTKDLRLGLGLVGDLTKGLGPAEDQWKGLGPVGDLTKGLGPTEDLRGYLHAEPLPCQSIKEEAREEFLERCEPVHHSSPVTGVSL